MHMYRCCNVKRFLIMLLCDLVAVGLLMLLFRCSLFRTEGVSDPRENGIPLPVLMYHSVFSGRHSDYVVPPEVLESDFAYLSDHGYQAVLVSDLVEYVYNGKPLPEKPVMITFDDGYYNNLEQCLPLLEKYDMCAVISVVGSYIVNQAEQDSHITAYSYLTFPEIQTLLESGRIEIGNHTYDLHSHTHRQGCGILPEESETAYRELLRSDLEQLQSLLASQVQMRPVVFTYPYGYVCRESIPVLRSMGFLATLTCYEEPNRITRDPDCLFGIGRYNRPYGISTDAYMQKALKGS